MLNNRLGDLHAALTAAGIPIDGVARLTDGSVRIDFQATATSQQKTDAAAMAAAWDWTPRQPRRLYDIWQALNALSAGQQSAIWTDITSGTPPKWALAEGDNAGAILALHWSALNSGATTANLNDAKRRLVAMYCQMYPNYLIHPSFDSTINVPGDEAIS